MVPDIRHVYSTTILNTQVRIFINLRIVHWYIGISDEFRITIIVA